MSFEKTLLDNDFKSLLLRQQEEMKDFYDKWKMAERYLTYMLLVNISWGREVSLLEWRSMKENDTSWYQGRWEEEMTQGVRNSRMSCFGEISEGLIEGPITYEMIKTTCNKQIESS